MKSFLDNINSLEGLNQLQIEKLKKLLKPFAADMPGTSMHTSLMRRRILSLITNPIVRKHGVFTWFNTVTPSDFNCPLLFTNLVKKKTMSWKESETAVHNLNLKGRKTLLQQHPALFCRLFEIKQWMINEHILDGNNAPGEIILYVLNFKDGDVYITTS